MPRVKRGVTKRRRHRRILNEAEGYFGTRSTLVKVARETVERAWRYAYRDRRQRKRDFRSLWIARINAAARQHELSYSQLIHGLGKAGVEKLHQVAEQNNRDPKTIGLAFYAGWFDEGKPAARLESGERYIMTGSSAEIAEDIAALGDLVGQRIGKIANLHRSNHPVSVVQVQGLEIDDRRPGGPALGPKLGAGSHHQKKTGRKVGQGVLDHLQ